MLKMELFLYQDTTSLFLRLLSNYINAEKKNIIKILSLKETTKKLLNLPEQPFLVTSKNETVNDSILISQILTNFAGRSEDLFGNDLDRVESNINFIKNSRKQLEDPLKFLEHINSHLLYNTFVNGFHITISDLFAYSQIIKFLGNLSEVEKNKYTNILRWVNHLQSLENLKDSIKELQLNIPIPFEPLVFVKEELQPKCNLKNKPVKVNTNIIPKEDKNFNAEKNPTSDVTKPSSTGNAKDQKQKQENQVNKSVETKEQNGKKDGEEKAKKGI